LGLAPGSALAAIKKAYLREIKIWHPDRYSPDSILRGNAEERTKALTTAYAALTAALKASNQEGVKGETAQEQREGARQQKRSESTPRHEEEQSTWKWIGRRWRRLKAQWKEGSATPVAAPTHTKAAPKRRQKPSRHPRFDDVLEAARKGPQTPVDISVVRRRLAARRARYGRRSGSGATPIEPIKPRGPVPPVDRIHPIGKDS
jgi:curved DNA-binding protein CbpA